MPLPEVPAGARIRPSWPWPTCPGESEPKDLGALDAPEGQVLHDHVKTVFQIWVILFSVVGAQMGWVLRPFVGNPNVPFAWFRGRESNFFEAVFRALASLFS